jgi:hypothetical protein
MSLPNAVASGMQKLDKRMHNLTQRFVKGR